MARAAVLGVVVLVGCGFDSGGVGGTGMLQGSSSSAETGAATTSVSAGTDSASTGGSTVTDAPTTSSPDTSTSHASAESSSGAPTSGDTSTGDSEGPPPFGPFAEPVEIAELNTSDSDDDPSLSPDLREIYFASLRPGGEGSEDIWRATRDSPDDPFGIPEPVAALNGIYQDGWPELSHDGLVLTMTSNRVGGEGPFDVYVAVRGDLGQEFGEPVLAADLSTPASEGAVALSATMLEAFYCSPFGDAADLHVATRADPSALFDAFMPLDSVNSGGRDCTPFIDESGTRLVFSSDRRGTVGAIDLWTSERDAVGGVLDEPMNITELNTTTDDDDPWWAPDGSALYFASSRGGADDLDLYVAYRE